MTPTGSEQGAKSPEKTDFLEQGNARSDARSADGAQTDLADAGLTRLIEAWPSLSSQVQAAILEMAGATTVAALPSPKQ